MIYDLSTEWYFTKILIFPFCAANAICDASNDSFPSLRSLFFSKVIVDLIAFLSFHLFDQRVSVFECNRYYSLCVCVCVCATRNWRDRRRCDAFPADQTLDTNWVIAHKIRIIFTEMCATELLIFPLFCGRSTCGTGETCSITVAAAAALRSNWPLCDDDRMCDETL